MSNYLDDIYDIRVKPGRAERQAEPEVRVCEWHGCDRKADHKAPRSPDEIRKWRWFCLEHVRAYNKQWNFFKGLSEDEIRERVETGNMWDRPTWTVGTNGKAPNAEARAKNFKPGESKPGRNYGTGHRMDPFDLFEEGPGTERAKGHFVPEERLPKRTRKALAALNLDPGASLQDVKARYKEYLIRLHPDTNGGDRSKEDRLNRVIEAFNHLRAVKYGEE